MRNSRSRRSKFAGHNDGFPLTLGLFNNKCSLLTILVKTVAFGRCLEMGYSVLSMTHVGEEKGQADFLKSKKNFLSLLIRDFSILPKIL